MAKYDAVIIGSGHAGNPLSQKLADLGWGVALVEEGRLGGTCVNTGGTPARTMVASAQAVHCARNAARGVADAATDRIPGAVMLAGAPWTVLKGAAYIHPTLAEGFWTLMEEVKEVE
jgi:pyruvate/2-oxoglutarate dehydrogenase complex dihydrolipoamide dehydrogenase (E3) component